MAIIQKSANDNSEEDVEKKELILLVGMQIDSATMENCGRSLKK